jgi:uncharacterized membrane protein YqaE (UPF0057 family)
LAYCFSILLPPLGVLLGKGLGWAFIINILLTLLGYFPASFTRFGYRAKAKRATVNRYRYRSAPRWTKLLFDPARDWPVAACCVASSMRES